jgi:hypothetical protein
MCLTITSNTLTSAALLPAAHNHTSARHNAGDQLRVCRRKRPRSPSHINAKHTTTNNIVEPINIHSRTCIAMWQTQIPLRTMCVQSLSLPQPSSIYTTTAIVPFQTLITITFFYETYERYTWVKHICTRPYISSSPAFQNRPNADWHTAWCSGHRLQSTGLCVQR